MYVVADSGAAVEHAAAGLRASSIPRPGLFEVLGAARRVVHVSAPAGSGKTFLLRSWIAAAGLGDRAAWVSVGRGEHDPQVFWLSVLDSLRQTGAGSERVRELTAAPHLDGANVVGRLLEDLSSLREPLWLGRPHPPPLRAQDPAIPRTTKGPTCHVRSPMSRCHPRYRRSTSRADLRTRGTRMERLRSADMHPRAGHPRRRHWSRPQLRHLWRRLRTDRREPVRPTNGGLRSPSDGALNV